MNFKMEKKFDDTMKYNMMSDVMSELENMGYTKGDTISFYEFDETCYALGIDSSDINLEYFEIMYGVTIG